MKTPHYVLAALAVTSLALTACGGGSSDSSTTTATTTTTSTSTVTTPVITTQPSSVSVGSGSVASFTVVATGTSLSYQWYKDGAAISGATSATYSISAATSSNAGAYTVVVTNTAGSVTSSSATLTIASTTVGANTPAVVAAANAFLATLSTTQQTVATSATSASTVLFGFTLANAEYWSNLPGARHGLRLNSSTLSTAQLAAASTVISTALSSTGNTMLSEIRLADDVINAANANGGWGSGLYSIAFVGTPSTTSAWTLQITGHHIAYNITYNAAYVSGSPTFIGVEPPNWSVSSSGAYTVNITAASSGTQHAPLEAQRAAVSNLATLIQADSTLSASAKLSGTYTDVVMGIGTTGDSNFGSLAYPTTGRGVLYSSLSATGQAYVKAAIEAWVNTQAADVATPLLAAYEDDTALAATYVAYAPGQGGTADFSAYPNALASPLTTQHSYLRIDGPRIWIEFVVQQGVAYTSYVHYHSLWRDKVADYGGSFGTGSGK